MSPRSPALAKPEPPKVVLTSGFGYTGSGAVLDLLSEYEGFRTPEEEFRIIRDPDGISSLEQAVVHDWSLQRVDRALKRFWRLVEVLGRRRIKFLRYGMNWDRNCNGRFFSITQEYLSSLIELRYAGHSVHDYYEASDVKYILMKTAERFRVRRTGELWMGGPGAGFLPATREYFGRLVASVAGDESAVGVVLNQAASATRPQGALEYLDRGYVIVVDRDPRDVYVESRRQRLTMFMPGGELGDFVTWYRRHREEAARLTRPHPRVLHVQFEDLVLNYDDAVSRIMRFLDLTPDRHRDPARVFDPGVSKRNVKMWKDFPRQDEIGVIEQELEEFLWTS